MRKRIKIEIPEGVDPNGIDFSKFNENKFLLNEHQWNELPLGMVTDVKLSYRGLYFTPSFHKITDASKCFNFLYRHGLIPTAQIGGVKDGDKFILYEVSLCSPQSNN